MDADQLQPESKMERPRRSMERLVRLVRLDAHWKQRRRENGKPWKPVFWEYLPATPEVTGRDEWPAIPWRLTIWLVEKYAIIIQPNAKLTDD